MNTIETMDSGRGPEADEGAHFEPGHHDMADFISMMAEAEDGKGLNSPEEVKAQIEQIMSQLYEKLKSLFEQFGLEIELPDLSQITSSMDPMGKETAPADVTVEITVGGTGALEQAANTAPAFEELDSQPVPVSEASVRADLQERESSPWSRYDSDNLPAIDAHLEQMMSKINDIQKSTMNTLETFGDEALGMVEALEQIFNEAVSKLEKLGES